MVGQQWRRRKRNDRYIPEGKGRFNLAMLVVLVSDIQILGVPNLVGMSTTKYMSKTTER